MVFLQVFLDVEGVIKGISWSDRYAFLTPLQPYVGYSTSGDVVVPVALVCRQVFVPPIRSTSSEYRRSLVFPIPSPLP